MPKILWLYFKDGHIQTYIVDDIVVDYDHLSKDKNVYVEYIVHNGTNKRRVYFNDLNRMDVKERVRKE